MGACVDRWVSKAILKVEMLSVKACDIFLKVEGFFDVGPYS